MGSRLSRDVLNRSKTIWHRGWVRIRCHSCGHLMFRPDLWFGRMKGYLTCPKCKTRDFGRKLMKNFAPGRSEE